MSGFRWRRGHTLLQLAAAMAILALLVLAAMPAYRESRMRGYLAEARQIAREWAHLARAWYLEKGSWQGASDQAIGWVNPNSRFWIYGPHRYGPEGFPQEAWFVATLRPGLASGAALAQGQTPDYLFVLRPSGEIAECGTLTHRDCQGRNLAGEPPPQNPPGNLRVLAKTHNSISVAWDDTPTETSYTVRWRKSSSGSWDGQAPLAQDTTSYTISGLLPETEYLVQVEATGPGGTAAAGPISVTTDGTAPPAATNLQVTATTDTSISLSWQDNATNETGYRVEHRQQGASSWTQGPNLPANTTSHTVSGLLAGYNYELRVVAFNSWGSTPSTMITAQTQGIVAPSNLTQTDATMDSITVSWSFPDSGAVSSFVLSYRDASSTSNPWLTITVPGSARSYTISGLSSFKQYNVKIQSQNSSGLSAEVPSSSGLATYTLDRPVFGISVNAVPSPSSIRIQWSDELASTCRYRVRWRPSGSSSWTGDVEHYDPACNPSYSYTISNVDPSSLLDVQVGTVSGPSGSPWVKWGRVYRVSASLVYEEDFVSPDSNTWQFNPYLFGANRATAMYPPQPGRLENRPPNGNDLFPKLEGVSTSFLLNGRVTARVNIYAPYRSDRGAGVRHRDRLLVLFRQNDSSCGTGKAAWVGVGTISGGSISIDPVMRQRLGCINSSSTPYSATLTIESNGSTMRTYIDGNLLWEFTNNYSYGYAGVCLSYHNDSSTPPGTPYHNIQNLRIERFP
jgi:hypothetical protein